MGPMFLIVKDFPSKCSRKLKFLRNLDIKKRMALIKISKTRKALHKKLSFPLRISLVNVTKSAGNCGFGHIY